MKTICLADLAATAERLVEQVRQDGFNPDIVVYVERAGRLPGMLIAELLNKPAIGISASRTGSEFKDRFSAILRRLPRWAVNCLRYCEVRTRVHRHLAQRSIDIHGDLHEAKTILLVDDSVDTGYSINAIIVLLAQKGISRNMIRVAAITTASMRHLQPIIVPDYYIYQDEIVRFPWSVDSTEYPQFLDIYNRYGKAR